MNKPEAGKPDDTLIGMQSAFIALNLELDQSILIDVKRRVYAHIDSLNADLEKMRLENVTLRTELEDAKKYRDAYGAELSRVLTELEAVRAENVSLKERIECDHNWTMIGMSCDYELTMYVCEKCKLSKGITNPPTP